MSAPTLDLRALGRATLARQHLLARVAMAPEALVEHLVGFQAQEPLSWYVTWWTRISSFDPVAAGRLLEERRLVRTWLMRGTIHLATADDAPLLRRFSQPALDRHLGPRNRQRLANLDLAELVVAVRAATVEPRTPADLVRILAARWPAAEPLVLGVAARMTVPLVQVPPRGVWGRSGAVRLTPLEGWIGRPVPDAVDAAAVVRRYLAAFGPASVADAQAWSGVARLREAFDRLRPELVTFRDPIGRELFDLPDAPRPDAETPAPPRFLAEYDNVLLGHADRTRFGGDRERELLTYVEGPYPSSLLVDGRLAGRWWIERGRDEIVLRVETIDPLAAEVEAAIRAEGGALLAFLAADADADARRIRIGRVAQG